jgi:hypothetical protein
MTITLNITNMSKNGIFFETIDPPHLKLYL